MASVIIRGPILGVAPSAFALRLQKNVAETSFLTELSIPGRLDVMVSLFKFVNWGFIRKQLMFIVSLTMRLQSFYARQ